MCKNKEEICKVEIAGVHFTPEALYSLKEWIVPVFEPDSSVVCCDVATIDSVQSFLMRYWDNFPAGSDTDVKIMLTELQLIKERLSLFATLSKLSKPSS